MTLRTWQSFPVLAASLLVLLLATAPPARGDVTWTVVPGPSPVDDGNFLYGLTADGPADAWAVGEELAGRIAAFLSIDGAGFAIANTALGSYRHRVTVTGPGGHSYRAFGVPNPNVAISRAVARAAAVPLPREPRATFNIGRIEGGTGPNRLPDWAMLEVEVRNSDSHLLGSLSEQMLEAIRAGIDDESRAATLPGDLRTEVELLGYRPAGQIPEESAIVRVARSATAAVGAEPVLEAHSTDANYPISIGIPALTLGVGAPQRDTHSLRESFDTTGAWRGVARALLTVLGLAG